MTTPPEPDMIVEDPVVDLPPMHTNYDEMAAAILARLTWHLSDTDSPADLTPKLATAMSRFVEDWFIKYAQGQREHGGDIRHRDMRIDRRKELMDLLSYELIGDLQPPSLQITL